MTTGASHRRRCPPRATSADDASTSPPTASTRRLPLAAPHAGQYTAAAGIASPQLGQRADDRPTPATVPVGLRRATGTPLLHSRPVAGSLAPLAAGGPVRLPSTCLVVLVGPSGAGKSTWAATQFRASQVVSTDALRALVGEGDHDQRAGADAFAVLDDVLERRLRRRLLTVVDSLGLEPARRRGWLAPGPPPRRALPCRSPSRRPPPCAGSATASAGRRCRRASSPRNAGPTTTALDALGEEGFDGVHEAADVEIVPPALVAAPIGGGPPARRPAGAALRAADPVVHLGGRTGVAGRAAGRHRRRRRGRRLHQPLGDGPRPADPVHRPASGSTCSRATRPSASSPARTARIRLGTMVTGHHVPQRRPPGQDRRHPRRPVGRPGDVRAGCGVVRARAQGLRLAVPTAGRALRAARGRPAAPAAAVGAGHAVVRAASACGCRRPSATRGRCRSTCRSSWAARGSGAPFGSWPGTPTPATCAAIRRSWPARSPCCEQHCRSFERDPATVTVTHLGTALVGRDRGELDALIERLQPKGTSPEAYQAWAGAGTVEEQIGRFRELAELGVADAIVSLPDLGDTAAVERFAAVIDAFR